MSEATTLQDIAAACYGICGYELFTGETDMFCRLHEPGLYGADQNAHVCIGCNLNAHAMVWHSAMNPSRPMLDSFDLFSNTILHAYVLVERIGVFAKLFGITDNQFADGYPVLQQVRKWANFIKHPKTFMLVHDPQCYFGECDRTGKIVIDSDFVKTYYSNGTRNTELYEILKNKNNVVVMFPVLDDFVESICHEYKHFVNSVLTTDAYRSILANEAKLEAYFSSDAVNGDGEA